jgi:hypothetical protein
MVMKGRRAAGDTAAVVLASARSWAGKPRLLTAALLLVSLVATAALVRPRLLRPSPAALTGQPLAGTHADPAGPASAKAQVAMFVRTALAGRVVAIEAVMARADRQIRAYCSSGALGGDRCFETGMDVHVDAAQALADGLARQALVLTATGDDLAALPSPRLTDPRQARQLDYLVEDVALCGEQFAALLQEMVTILTDTTSEKAPPLGQALANAAYPERAAAATRLLHRAAEWLVALDRETGAGARLPGFEGGLAFDQQLTTP